MKIKDRENLNPILVSRVIENAPVKELIRVYGEAVTTAISNLSDEELAQTMQNAGYDDLIENFVDASEITDDEVKEPVAPKSKKVAKAAK